MTSKPLRGRTVLIALLAFFSVIVGMNILMATFALGTFDGQVDSNAYRSGLKFNDRIEAARSQAATGWAASINVNHSMQIIEVRLTMAQSAALTNVSLDGQLWRQSVQGMDFALVFVEVESGRYAADIPKDAFGRFELRLSAARAGTVVAFKREIDIEPRAKGAQG